MDIAVIWPWVSGLISLITLVTLVKNMLSSGEKKLDERLGKVEGKLVEHDRRVQSIESDMKHLPDRNTTHRLELMMAEIVGRLNTMEKSQDGRFSTMEERLKPIQAVGERLEEVLVEQAKQASRNAA